MGKNKKSYLNKQIIFAFFPREGIYAEVPLRKVAVLEQRCRPVNGANGILPSILLLSIYACSTG